MKDAYRPDIDGMRAVSVMAVILFHFGVPGFAGGFVGVDVFFVISGYLITRQLQDYRGSPVVRSLGDFYLRRARRILPASLAMLAVVTPVALLLLLPFDLKMLGRGIAMGVAFLGNIAAWKSGNYFVSGDMPSPLLHLWSLAVEEQFYFAFPLLLLAAGMRSARLARLIVLAVAAISFALCAWATVDHRAVAFYFTPMRAWELMLGSLLALGQFAEMRRPATREICALAGIAILLVAIVAGGGQFWWPWLHALAPCVGAMLLIHSSAHEPTRVARLLSIRPVVFVGLISYSLYLWHMPVHVLARYFFIEPLTVVQQFVLLAAIGLLAVLSWKFVEQPVRRRRVLATGRSLCVATGGLSIALFAMGCALWKTDGFPQRFTAEVRQLADMSKRFHRDAIRCFRVPMKAIAAGELCQLHAEPAEAPRAVLWGDSHALALLPALENLAISHRWQMFVGTHSACRPLLGIATTRDSMQFSSVCTDFNHAMIEGLSRLNPRLVVLAAYWFYPNGDFTIPGRPELESHAARFEYAFEETVRQISSPGRTLCIVRGVPRLDFPVPYALARARVRGIDPDSLRLSVTAAREQYAAMEPVLARLVQQRRVVAVDPKDRLCDARSCRLVNDEGNALYSDSNHLSIAGAVFVTDSLAGCFDAVR